MQPIRDPAIAGMSWEGWTFLGKGQPQDGGLFLVRLRYVTGGMCPEERIEELQLFYRGGKWTDGGEKRLSDPRAVIAWRQLSRRDKALLDAGRPLPAVRSVSPTDS